MTITGLPVELLQRIAAHGTFDDILCFARTCRHLRDACHDEVVFSTSFVRHMGDPTSKALPDANAVRDRIQDALLNSAPAARTAVWARLAAAASRLPRLVDELDSLLERFESVPWESNDPWPDDLPLTNIVGVLSTLTVLGYPSVNEFTVTAALIGLQTHILAPRFCVNGPQLNPFHAAQLAFCLAVGSLGNGVLNNMPVFSSRLSTYLVSYRPGDEGFLGGQAKAFMIVADMPWLLGFHQSEWVSSGGGGRPQPNLARLPLMPASRHHHYHHRRGSTAPTAPTHIPLPDLDEDMMRFLKLTQSSSSSSCMSRLVSSMSEFNMAFSWSAWLQAAADAVIMIDGEDGEAEGEAVGEDENENENGEEWIGWLVDDVHSNKGTDSLEGPLRRIFFRASRPVVVGHVDDQDVEQEGEVVLLSAVDCEDGPVTFSLSGSLSRRTGAVTLRQAFDVGGGSYFNMLHGWLTPLGIAGYICTRGSEYCDGFFWLFKKEWTPR